MEAQMKIITGMLALLAAANGALAQTQTLSARPGLVNYVEGDASARPRAFINAGETFSTGTGKAEILLMPGVFLRLGDSSEIRMLTPSLVDTRLELLQGEAMIEAVGIIRGSQVSVTASGAVITINANGLYRIRSNTAAVYSGSLDVTLGTQTIKLGKNHQTQLVVPLRSEKMNLDEADELYAWSSVRSQYEAAASYQAALTSRLSGQNQTGWLFYDLFDTWAWLPQQTFFSPYGWGYYPAGLAGSAPVVVCTVMRGGHWGNGPHPIGPARWFGLGSTREVPIDPKHPPVVNFVAGTPRVQQQMRSSQQVSVLSRRGTNSRTMQARAVSHNQVRVSSNRASSGGASRSGGSSGRSSSHSGASRSGGGSGASHSSGASSHK